MFILNIILPQEVAFHYTDKLLSRGGPRSNFQYELIEYIHTCIKLLQFNFKYVPLAKFEIDLSRTQIFSPYEMECIRIKQRKLQC